MPIPDFAPNGTLPPYIDNDPTKSSKRSPYQANIFELVTYFCTSNARATLLKGLNAYRKHLFEGGFTSGYQWIDGSFVENVEKLRGRAPGDIDVVTLFNRPIKYQGNGGTWVSDYRNNLHADFFETQKMKPIFRCDTYSIDLDAGHHSLVRDVSFWNSLFSDIKWSTEKKGIVSIPLPKDPMEFLAVDNAIGGMYDV